MNLYKLELYYIKNCYFDFIVAIATFCINLRHIIKEINNKLNISFI